MSSQPHDRRTEGERGKEGGKRGGGGGWRERERDGDRETDRLTDRQIFINSLSELMTAQVQAIQEPSMKTEHVRILSLSRARSVCSSLCTFFFGWFLDIAAIVPAVSYSFHTNFPHTVMMVM